MAIFFDFHPSGEVSVEAVRQCFADAQRGRADQSGCRPLDYYLATPGSVYCVLEAPSAAAVRQFHADRAMPCSVVRSVGGMPGDWPLEATAQAVLQRVVASHWQVTGQPAAAPPGELAG
jgi:Protein of unknown function (DUF4242)